MSPSASADVDLERALPLAEIRTHTKTDDVPHVTDAQLVLYRRAAFEAAEQYTGRHWHGTVMMEVPVATASKPRHGVSRVRLPQPVLDGVVTLVGPQGNRVLRVPPGATTIDVPVMFTALDSCCSDCPPVNVGTVARYRTGIDCPTRIPAGILLGVLKFIAWSLENVGDRLVTVDDRDSRSGGVLQGSNSAAWGSGAIEQWRQYVPAMVR